jgi:hypothetical protein
VERNRVMKAEGGVASGKYAGYWYARVLMNHVTPLSYCVYRVLGDAETKLKSQDTKHFFVFI